MTTLDPKAAFFHVIDPHRWLAASGCAWNLVGVGAENSTKDAVDQLVPNICVMARDGLLLHARSLIKFYRNVGRKTDIILSDFGVSALSQSLDQALEEYEHSIEVHLLHITDWRDFDSAHRMPVAAERPEGVRIGIMRPFRFWNSSSNL